MPRPRNTGVDALRRAGAVLGRAETWLLLVAAGAWWRLHDLGLLVTDRVKDTPSYEWPWEVMSISDVLMNARTIGYPVVLEVWSRLFDGQDHLPLFQLLVYVAAVFVFWHALARYSGSKWFSLAAAVPLLVTDLWPYFRRLQPDTLAPAAALVAIAALIHLAIDASRKWLWLTVAVAVGATYHLRPSYVFMAALAPVLGCVFRAALRQSSLRSMRRFAACLLLVCLLPVFVYAAVRGLTVKQFGVANMVGYSIVGISASFLDQETVEAVPGEHRRLADRILYWRGRREWSPYTFESDSREFFDQYVANQWSIAEPLARRFEMDRRSRLRDRGDPDAGAASPLEAWYFENPKRTPLGGDLSRAISDQLQDLSLWLMRDKPHLYRKWIVDASIYGLRGIAKMHTVRWSAALLALSLLAWLVTGGWRRRRRTIPMSAAVWSLWALAAGYYLASLALMVLVSYPLDRYQAAATLFFAPAMIGSTFAVWRNLWLQRRTSSSVRNRETAATRSRPPVRLP